MDGTHIVYSSGSSQKYVTIVASEPFSSGYHEWEVTLESCGDDHVGPGNQLRDTFVGISENNTSRQYCGVDHASWGYYANNGHAYHSNSKNYGQPYKTGDVIFSAFGCGRWVR